MTMSEVWPRLRPLCRKLALLGWASSAAGMAAGLAVAIASGTRLSPVMSTLQLVAGFCMAVAVATFVTAAAVQPRPRAQESVNRGSLTPQGRELHLDHAGEFPVTAQAFLLGALA